LRQCGLTAASGPHLAGCRHLCGLIELRIATAGTGSVVGDLARSPHLPALRSLDVQSASGLSEADADALVRSPLAPNLRCLRLRGLSQAVQKVLLTARSLSGLTSLCISGQASAPVNGRVGKWLREATHLKNLTHLDISLSRLGNEGVAELARSPHLARLTVLEIDGNGVPDAGLRPLAESPYLNGLKKVRCGRLFDEEVRQVLQARFGDVSE
jgi:hypothetical protein